MVDKSSSRNGLGYLLWKVVKFKPLGVMVLASLKVGDLEIVEMIL